MLKRRRLNKTEKDSAMYRNENKSVEHVSVLSNKRRLLLDPAEAYSNRSRSPLKVKENSTRVKKKSPKSKTKLFDLKAGRASTILPTPVHKKFKL